jgi:hypothetical protein
MVRKGQIRWLPKSDILGQAASYQTCSQSQSPIRREIEGVGSNVKALQEMNPFALRKQLARSRSGYRR